MKRWQVYLIIAAALFIAAQFTAISLLWDKYKAEKLEKERQESNVSVLMGDVNNYRYRDSLKAVSVSALQLSIDELKKYRAKDARLIADLNIKLKRVESVSSTTIQTKDSLVFIIQKDSCFHYSDPWLKIDACLGDSSMYIVSSDSIVQIIHREYKHKFLFWRWGTKGYRQEIINFNPHSTIKFSELILLKNNY